MSLRETGLMAVTGHSRHIELFQLRDDHGFAPDIPASAMIARRAWCVHQLRRAPDDRPTRPNRTPVALAFAEPGGRSEPGVAPRSRTAAGAILRGESGPRDPGMTSELQRCMSRWRLCESGTTRRGSGRA
jgi:hypothetical protein